MATVIDTIIHLFEPPSGERPHVAPGVQHGMDSLPPEEMFLLMDDAQVDMAIQVTSGIMGYDNRYSIEAAARHPGRLRVVARFDPVSPDVDGRLAALMSEPLVVGVRLTYGGGARDGEANAALGDGRLDRFWRAAEAQGVPVEIFASGDIAFLAPVLSRHPDLVVMLDHIGVARYGPLPLTSWKRPTPVQWNELFDLLPFGNLTVRVSALPEMTAEPYPFRQAQTMLQELHSRFGAGRLMWGSNYPPSSATCPYRQTVQWIREGCRFLSPQDIDLILGANAARAFRLDATAAPKGG